MNKSLFLASTAFVFLIATSGCNNSANKKQNTDLTDAEERIINNFVESVPIEAAVGQLFMVGFPSDINTVKDSGSTATDEVVSHLGIGSAIVNKATYFDDSKLNKNEYISKIINFNNAVQEKTLNSKLRIPLLIATDFEGPNFTSIKRGFTLPPSALSLGASQNPDLIREMGSYVGLELKNVGIHAILGPVLDIYNVNQGNKNVLQDRCFSSTPEGVSKISSHYIKGLKESRIAIFAKHFPSHGSIETNPHDKIIPKYEGSEEQLKNDIKPFEFTHKSTNGVMTSHIIVPSVNEGQLASFSSQIVSRFRNNKNFSNHILITDDLSEIGAVQTYMKNNRYSYSDIARQAFNAGHDLLLFAHCNEGVTQKSRSNKELEKEHFSIKDLRTVINDLTIHIKSSDYNTQQFRNSLKRIIKLKVAIAKDMNIPIEEFLSNEKQETLFYTKNDGRKAIEVTENTINPNKSKDTNKNYGEKLVRDILKESATIISGKPAISEFRKISNSQKIIFATYDDGVIYKFQNEFKPIFSNAIFYKIPTTKDGIEFKKLEESIINNFDNTTILIYTAFDNSDAHLLRRLYDKNKVNFSNKVIIFCHNSPAIFDIDVLQNSTIIGLFTKHPTSFEIDIDILKGNIMPKSSLASLPINIGKYHTVQNSNLIDSANEDQFNNLFKKINLTEEKIFISENHIHIRKDIASILPSLILVLISLSISIIAYIAAPRLGENYKGENYYWITTTKLLSQKHIPFLISFLIFLSLTTLFFYSNEAQNIINTISSHEKVSR